MTTESATHGTTVTLASGIRLHYRETGQEHERTLVLLHGVTDSSGSFDLVAPLLCRHFRVLALDFRGHGLSERVDGEYTIARLAKDVVEFLDCLGISSATLVGHSMGSFVARRVAIDSPTRVEKLVLVGTGISPDNAVVRALAMEVESFTRESIPIGFVTDFQAGCVADVKELPAEFFNACVAASAAVPSFVWRAALRGLVQSDDQNELAALRCPTLVLGGRGDLVFRLGEQQETVRAIPGAIGRFYSQAGHTPHWEEPERFARDLNEYVLGTSRVEDITKKPGREVSRPGMLREVKLRTGS